MLRDLRAEDRPALAALLVATRMFSEEEVDVALEVIDAGLSRPGGDYQFVVAEESGQVAGYGCFGRSPMTDATWDLYWLAVHPSLQGRGIGARLLRRVEELVAAQGGRLLVVETAGKPEYAGTRAFYERSGYPEHARLRDFYRDGDDKVVHVRRLR